MKKFMFLLVVLGVLLTSAEPALACHRSAHKQPPGCTPGNMTGNDRKHCYPRCTGSATQIASQNTRFLTTPAGGGITVGMLMIAGLGTFSVVVATRRLRRRLVS